MAGVKGKSGGKRNGGGRPKGATGKAKKMLRELITDENVKLAIKTLTDAIQNGNIDAAKYLLDQKFGKPRQSMEMEHTGGVTIIRDSI